MRAIVKMEPTYKANGAALRYWRSRRHLTGKQLEKKSGVSYTSISRIETGQIVSPRFETLQRLADALNLEVDDLTVYPDPPESLID